MDQQDISVQLAEAVEVGIAAVERATEGPIEDDQRAYLRALVFRAIASAVEARLLVPLSEAERLEDALEMANRSYDASRSRVEQLGQQRAAAETLCHTLADALITSAGKVDALRSYRAMRW